MVEDAGFLADVGEHAAAVVAIQRVAERGEGQRVTVDAVLAADVAAEGVVVHSRIDVVDDEQIDVAVAIDVGERAAGAEHRRAGDACRFGDIGEAFARVVLIERVRPDAGDVEIDPAVVVDVGGAGAHAVADVRDAG